MGNPSTLADYVKVHGPGRRVTRCQVCILPIDVRDQIDAALREGAVSRAVMVEWLHAEGYEHITRPMVDYHKIAHVS